MARRSLRFFKEYITNKGFDPIIKQNDLAARGRGDRILCMDINDSIIPIAEYRKGSESSPDFAEEIDLCNNIDLIVRRYS